ncbi:hypothetical protein FS837_001055 [Tulasnella sp. UAMH 9824]|nr:hypothetical protein FS837_001055 [Tulasnella sp. UAMH 9824]
MKSDTSNSRRGRFPHVARPQPTQSAPRTDGDDLRRTVLSATTHGRSRSDVSGHPTSGGTPITPRTLQGSKSSELRSSIEPLIKNEIEQNVVEIRAEAFIHAFLYPFTKLDEPDPEIMERDRGLAEACHDMLKEGLSDDDVLMSMLTDARCPKYSKNAFTLLDPNVKEEKDLYTPFRKLFTFISAFYRLSLQNQSTPLDIDAAWPDAVDPKPGHTASLNNSLRRDVFDTHNMVLKFSPRLVGETADLKPDLVLMLHRDKDPDTKQPAVYWKDVKIPIEVKIDFRSEGDIIPQVARYARAMLMEQFDRKFAITVLLSATECRLFHWDSVGCHATEPIDIHKDPILFIRCIARLAMMTPEEFGYDDHFSNAGRVLSDQDITTALTVRESPIRQYIDRECSPEEKLPETATSMLLELDTGNFIFESRGILFHRHTRVWRGKEITDVKTWETGSTRIVKQNWAEDTRPCEGYFYKLAKEVPTVSSLLLMEECDHTWAYHNRIADQDMIGYLKATENKPDRQPRRKAAQQAEGDWSTFGPDPQNELNTLEQRSRTPLTAGSKPVDSLERVLLRFVFEEEYRPLSDAKDSKEVMDATVQWVQGLITLDSLGIVHRDISYSNLMLPVIDSTLPRLKPAKIIDLGLAHWKDPQRSEQAPSRSVSSAPEIPTDGQGSLSKDPGMSGARAPRAHHHITGTLPFIAWELIQQPQNTSNASYIEHGLHHDVESIFWVLVYLCHFRAGKWRTEDMAITLERLNDPRTDVVASKKENILGMSRHTLTQIAGQFYKLRDFLKAFADYWFACYLDNKPIDVFKVLYLAIEHRDKLGQSGQEAAALVTVQQRAPVTPPRLTATVDSSKRKSSTFEDPPEIDERREEESEDVVGARRKKTKLP